MNIKRLINIAQEADNNGDYVTADKVTNLLKTAQGQYSVYPNQAAYSRTPQQSQQMLAAQQNQQNQNSSANQQMPQMPQMQQINQQLPQMPQMNQQPTQQGGIYYAPVAQGATYYTPGVVNVAQPQMTEEQKAFAKLRGDTQNIVPFRSPQKTTKYIYQANSQANQQQPNTPGFNMNLYGTGYASMAMQPQQAQTPYNPQQQPQ